MRSGRHFEDDIFKCIFISVFFIIIYIEVCFQLEISQLGTAQATSHYLNQWWHSLSMHICHGQPQWVNGKFPQWMGQLFNKVNVGSFRFLKHCLPHVAMKYNINCLQVLPQLSCGDTRQIRLRFKWFNAYFTKSVACLEERLAIAKLHYNDVIMGAMASQITSLTIVYSTVYSGANQRKHHSSASLAFVNGIHRWPVNSPHKVPATRKMNVSIWWRHHE